MAKIEVFGHRGRGVTDGAHAASIGADRGDKPAENTLDAFRQAVSLGAHGNELDAIKARDNGIVVVHSANLAAHIAADILQGRTHAADYTAHEIGQMPMGHRGVYRIPTLAGVFNDLKPEPTRSRINLEYKDTQGTNRAPETNPSLVDCVLATIAETEFPLDRIHGSSFSLTTMKEVAAKSPAQSIGLLFDLPQGEPFHGDGGLPMFQTGHNKDHYLLFTQNNIIMAKQQLPTLTALHPEIQSVGEDHVRLAADLGLSLYTWEWRGLPPNHPTDARFGKALDNVAGWTQKHGVDLHVITDFIPEVRQRLGLAQPA